MKSMLHRYYSLDECSDRKKVYDYLDILQEDGKIYFENFDEDVIKIKDVGLTGKDTKHLVDFFEKNDIIVYTDIDEDYEDDFFEDDDFDIFDEDEDEDF